MRGLTSVICLWPGLPRLWFRGEGGALLWAVVFGLLLNSVLITSLVWNELLSPALRATAWVVLVAWWTGSAALQWRQLRSRESDETESLDHLFRRSLDQYLQGNWLAAERLLTRLLALDGYDAEARLLLASLLRHTERHDEARRQLHRLIASQGGAKWQPEISHELQLLDEIAADNQHNADESQPAQTRTVAGDSAGDDTTRTPLAA